MGGSEPLVSSCDINLVDCDQLKKINKNHRKYQSVLLHGIKVNIVSQTSISALCMCELVGNIKHLTGDLGRNKKMVTVSREMMRWVLMSES